MVDGSHEIRRRSSRPPLPMIASASAIVMMMAGASAARASLSFVDPILRPPATTTMTTTTLKRRYRGRYRCRRREEGFDGTKTMYHHGNGRKINRHDGIPRSSTMLRLRGLDDDNSMLDREDGGGDDDKSINPTATMTTEDSSVVIDDSSMDDSSNDDADDALNDERRRRKWQAGDYASDKELLDVAWRRRRAASDLMEKRRRHTLDCGFANNRRPLLRDLSCATFGMCGWTAFLIRAGADGAGRRRLRVIIERLHSTVATSVVSLSILHHRVVVVALPLFLLALAKGGKLGPPGRALEQMGFGEYNNDVPSFIRMPKQRRGKAGGRRKMSADHKDTGDYVLCLLENWSSAVVLPLVVGSMNALFAAFFASSSSLGGRRRNAIVAGLSSVVTCGLGGGDHRVIDACARLLTRLGAASALHQYPSLLYELRRDDMPRPICMSTSYMRRAVRIFLDWLPLGVASDVAIVLSSMLLGRDRRGGGGGGANSPFLGGNNVVLWKSATSFLSLLPSFCHLIALGRIVCISRCSALSLSDATKFSTTGDENDTRGGEFSATTKDDPRRRVQWRYHLRWRTPQRLVQMLLAWRNYFFTGHVPLLLEMDEWNTGRIRFDDFSTEGAPYSMRGDSTVVGGGESSADPMPDVDAIAESLSLIFRDREAAIHNATVARSIKHQESYDTKTLDDVLGVAVHQTFGIGLSYDFDHFDTPSDDGEISVHQLRARMAKSAVRRKRELDDDMAKQLDVLRRLKENVVTSSNEEVAESEMNSVEQAIRDRHADEVNRMKDDLRTMIPTNSDAPKGTERYDSPIMVSQYVELKAAIPTGGGEFKVTRDSSPDSLSMIEEYVRRDFGDAAADAYRREELAALKNEKEMLLKFRRRYGELKDDGEVAESEQAFSDVDGV